MRKGCLPKTNVVGTLGSKANSPAASLRFEGIFAPVTSIVFVVRRAEADVYLTVSLYRGLPLDSSSPSNDALAWICIRKVWNRKKALIAVLTAVMMAKKEFTVFLRGVIEQVFVVVNRNHLTEFTAKESA